MKFAYLLTYSLTMEDPVQANFILLQTAIIMTGQTDGVWTACNAQIGLEWDQTHNNAMFRFVPRRVLAPNRDIASRLDRFCNNSTASFVGLCITFVCGASLCGK